MQAVYHSSPLRQWSVGGGVAGEVRSGGGLTFAMVEAAGHMVPMDQPEAVSGLIKSRFPLEITLVQSERRQILNKG